MYKYVVFFQQLVIVFRCCLGARFDMATRLRYGPLSEARKSYNEFAYVCARIYLSKCRPLYNCLYIASKTRSRVTNNWLGVRPHCELVSVVVLAAGGDHYFFFFTGAKHSCEIKFAAFALAIFWRYKKALLSIMPF